MRLTVNLLVVLLLVSIIVALSAGLIVESAELQRLTEQARDANCATIRSEFSHPRFVAYHLALLITAIAGLTYLVLISVSFLLRRLVDLISGRSI